MTITDNNFDDELEVLPLTPDQAPTVPLELARAVELADAEDAYYCGLLVDAGDDLPDLFELLAPRPPWMRDALCREHPEINFYPLRGESTAVAKTVCGRCLVRDECLAYALTGRIRVGVWGGLSGRQRDALSGRRPA